MVFSSFFCTPCLVSSLARQAHCAQSCVGTQSAGRQSKECFHLHQRHSTAPAKTVILMKTTGTSQLWDPSSGRAAKLAWNRPNNYTSCQEVLDRWDGRKKKKCECKNFFSENQATKRTKKSFNNSAVTLTQDLIWTTAVVPLTNSIFSDKEVNPDFIIMWITVAESHLKQINNVKLHNEHKVMRLTIKRL